jgi:hypothetical protein
MRSFQESIARGQAELAQLQQRARIAGQIEDMRRELERVQIGSRLNSLIATDSRLEVQRGMANTEGSMRSAARDLAVVSAEMDSYIGQWRSELAQQLAERRRTLADVTENLTKAQLRRDLVEFRAPVDAVVLELGKTSVGAVLAPGEQLVSLVPLDTALLIDAEVLPRDLGFVGVGDRVALKFETFPLCAARHRARHRHLHQRGHDAAAGQPAQRALDLPHPDLDRPDEPAQPAGGFPPAAGDAGPGRHHRRPADSAAVLFRARHAAAAGGDAGALAAAPRPVCGDQAGAATTAASVMPKCSHSSVSAPEAPKPTMPMNTPVLADPAVPAELHSGLDAHASSARPKHGCAIGRVLDLEQLPARHGDDGGGGAPRFQHGACAHRQPDLGAGGEQGHRRRAARGLRQHIGPARRTVSRPRARWGPALGARRRGRTGVARASASSQHSAASTASAGRCTHMSGMARSAARYSTGWCVGPLRPMRRAKAKQTARASFTCSSPLTAPASSPSCSWPTAPHDHRFALPRRPHQGRAVQDAHHPDRVMASSFRFAPLYADSPTARYMTHMFAMRSQEHGIEHRFTKINHPWTMVRVGRMNRTIKHPTVKRFHYDGFDQLRSTSTTSSRPTTSHADWSACAAPHPTSSSVKPGPMSRTASPSTRTTKSRD